MIRTIDNQYKTLHKKTNSAKLVTNDIDIDAMYIEEYSIMKKAQKAFVINNADVFNL
jgi:hypothetical protein